MEDDNEDFIDCDGCGGNFYRGDLSAEGLCADCHEEMYEEDEQETPLDTPSLDTSFHDHEMDV